MPHCKRLLDEVCAQTNGSLHGSKPAYQGEEKRVPDNKGEDTRTTARRTAQQSAQGQFRADSKSEDIPQLVGDGRAESGPGRESSEADAGLPAAERERAEVQL